MVCLSYAAWALWFWAIRTRPCKRSHEALTLAQELAHPFSLAFALDFAALVHQFRREATADPRAGRGADCALDRARVSAVVGVGNYPAGLGTGRAGTGRGRDCPDAPGPGCPSGHGGRGDAAVFSCPAGRGVWESGADQRKGLAVLAEALAVVDKTGERFYEAELYRLKGELTLQQKKFNKFRK